MKIVLKYFYIKNNNYFSDNKITDNAAKTLQSVLIDLNQIKYLNLILW